MRKTLCGSCRIIFGPMFSSKTTKLIQELTTCADVGLEVLYINYQGDTRVTEKSSTALTTHHSSFNGLSGKISTARTYDFSDVDVSEFDVIGIDEGQFFGNLPEIVRNYVLNLNKMVIIASLDGNANMMPFGRTHELICICEPGGIMKIPAKCMDCLKRSATCCGDSVKLVDAGFTKKIAGGTSEVDIGGADKYVSLCMKCHKARQNV